MTDKTNFECPILSLQEIIHFIKEVCIDVSEKDFRSPDPRKWRIIYGKMFEFHTGKNLDQVVTQILLANAMDKTYQDYREEACALMAYTLCMARLFSACGFKDFSLKEVLQPTPERLQQLSSCFLNMARHKTTRTAEVEEINDKIQKTVGESSSIISKNRELKERYEQAKLVQPSLEAEIKKLTEELEKEQLPIIELKKEGDEEMRLCELIKLRGSELKANKEQLKQTLAQLQQEIEALSSKVVKSPKRFRQEQERLKARVLDLKNELRAKEQQSSENRLLLEETVSKCLALQKAVKLSLDATSDTEKNNELDNKIKQLREHILEHQEVFKICATKEEDLLEKASIRQQFRNKCLSQLDMHKKSCLQHLKDMQQHQAKQEENVKSLKAEISQVQSQILAYHNDIEEMKNQLNEPGVQDFQRKCCTKTEEINDYNESLVNKIADLKAVLM